MFKFQQVPGKKKKQVNKKRMGVTLDSNVNALQGRTLPSLIYLYSLFV